MLTFATQRLTAASNAKSVMRDVAWMLWLSQYLLILRSLKPRRIIGYRLRNSTLVSRWLLLSSTTNFLIKIYTPGIVARVVIIAHPPRCH